MTAKFQHVLLVILSAVILTQSQSCFGSTTDLSLWCHNMSGPTDTTNTWQDCYVRVLTSGSYVHLFWYSYKSDDSSDRICYCRSTDGGNTFGSIQTLVSSGSGLNLDFGQENNPVVLDGNYIHLFYGQYVSNVWTIQYLRSADNGATFGAAKQVVGIYNRQYDAAAFGGGVNLAWNYNMGSQNSNAAYVARSSDNGSTWNTTTIASDTLSYGGYFVLDLVRDSSNVYLMWEYADGASPVSHTKMYVSASTDGGATFQAKQQFNVAASDGLYYATAPHDSYYAPYLAAIGSTCYLVWLNCDTYSTSSYSLRTRKLTGGTTLSTAITLKTYPNGFQNQYLSESPGGQSTIAAKGNYVYIASRDDDGTPFWVSSDSGATFGTVKLLSTAGWWPSVKTDPADSTGAKVHVLADWYEYFVSSNAGATFSGPVDLGISVFIACNRQQFAVGADGAILWAADGKFVNTDDLDIFFRRAATPVAGTTDMSLQLNEASSTRRDNMQVAANSDINFTSALTVEFWIKPVAGNYNYEEYMVCKKRASGYDSIDIGTWSSGQIYARLVTARAADQNSGDWLGASLGPVLNSWSHVAVTYDATVAKDNWRIYLNGSLVAKTTLTTGNLVTDMQPLVVGDDRYTSYGFQMSFFELRLWNVARTQAQIQAAMNSTLTGTESGLVGYYKFANSTADSTGRGNNGVLMYKESFGAAMTVPALPTITSITPASGALAGGNTVTIAGTNFATSGTVTVSFGANAATKVSVASATSLTCPVPSGSAGAVDVTVTNPNGYAVIDTGGYTYSNVPAPTLSSLSPTSGPLGGGTTVTLTGTGFATSGTVTVTFGGTAATGVSVVSATSITCSSPAGTGTVAVAVTNPDSQSCTLTNGFTYLATIATPTFSPVAGSYSSAQSVAISCSTSGATIYYTIDGTPPTTSSTVYSGALSVSITITIKAIAAAAGMTQSNVASATYTISGGGTPPAPTVTSPPSPPQPVAAGQPVTLTVVASDPGVGSLTYTWSFGDGTTGSGATVNHTYSSAGTFTATVTISNGVTSTTETVTVVSNPTSDTTDPTQFKVSKSSIKFMFNNKPNADSMSFSGTLPVATGFSPGQKSLNVYIGGYTSAFTLCAKGKCSNITGSITLSGKLSKTGGYTATPVKFTYSVKKQSLFADLQALGFSNNNVPSQSITVPILMDLDGDGYLVNVPVTYTAKKGKSGSAK